MKKIYLCKDCANPITRCGALYHNGRCRSCARKLQFSTEKLNYKRDKHPQWKGGRILALEQDNKELKNELQNRCNLTLFRRNDS